MTQNAIKVALDGKANSSHTHSYLPLSGGTLTGNVTISTDSKLEWNRNTDYARISFKNTGDDDSDSYMHFLTGDNGNEYFKFSSLSGSATTDLLTIKTDHLRYKGNAVYHAGNPQTSVSGNAGTATKLQTARTINGTSFDGSANITTANWGTARNIQIGNTSKSVNGSANVTWSLSEIGAAAASHNHGLLHDNFTVEVANTTTDSGWSMINSNYNGHILKSIRSNASAPAWLQSNYSAGIAFGGADTKGVISVAYNAPSIRFAGGNGSKPVWHLTVTGNSGKTYNLETLASNITSLQNELGTNKSTLEANINSIRNVL